MKKTVVCFIVGMIGVVQCFFCMAEDVTAKKGPGLWGFNEASCEKIQGLIGDTDAHDIEKLCGQSSEELAAKIAIMQVLLLKKQLELQQKNVVLDISPDKIKEIVQKMYLTRGGANSSNFEAGMIDGKAWYDIAILGPKGTKALEIYVRYYVGGYFYNQDYRNGVNKGSEKTFGWIL